MTMAGECCAPDHACEALGWARVHFGTADLGDQRRTRRLVKLAAAITEDPSMSLPKQLPEWSDLLGAYRLLSNEQVDPQAILVPHVQQVRRETAGHPVVLCVQDDTQLDFTLRTGIKGLGMTGDGFGRGLLQHASLAVLPNGRLLGVLDLAWHAIAKVNAGETRRQSQARWSMFDVWQEAATRIRTAG
jgi:hypothetical protein